MKRKEDDKVLRRIIASTADSKNDTTVHRRERRSSDKFQVHNEVPTTLEEAPIRRQDRRTLNALRRRRADKYGISLLSLAPVSNLVFF